ncbi:MAG: phosphoadenylyl-sulfate reductase [Oscillospiraceae bacterium]|nr:phosphoadenylyl-sulfate reductase [Bacteroidales bacterium]MBO5640619.1 phosphoadenylyl-sulfate reductase [Oscillospiraceae bacterium]
MTQEEKIALAAAKNAELLALGREEGTQAAIRWALGTFGRRAALSSSLSLEDQTVTQLMVAADKEDTRVFTLDTGRQFPETYELIDRTEMTYGIRIEVFFPDFQKVQEMVREHGINLFYDSIELRHLCCGIRKIEPLKRALDGVEVWITGLRRSQSVTRAHMRMVEYDADDDVLKLNPLLLWSEQDVKDYVRANAIPYNKLHDQGFPSIGCQPCTRAVRPGEDVRAGRWWWEDPDKRECGLHAR